MARRKRNQISVAEWSEAAESVWTPPASSTGTTPATPTSLTPKTILDGRPTKAHPWSRRFLPHHPASPARI